MENLFQRIKKNRWLAMRYEKLYSTFAGFLALAVLKLEVCLTWPRIQAGVYMRYRGAWRKVKAVRYALKKLWS